MTPHRCATGPDYTVPRRTVLAGAGAVVGFAGCLGDSEPADPVDLTGGLTCDVCGMVIEDHFGPACQAFFDDGPPDRDGPARFDSVPEMATYDAEVTWRLQAAFATDYSGVEYELERVDGTPYIPTVAEADAFRAVEELHFVVDSDVEGAMGPDAIPFSDQNDATVLTEEFGGIVVSWAGLPDALFS